MVYLIKIFRNTGKNIIFSWRYNEVVAWVRLFVYGTQLCGEYRWVKAKHIVRKGKREFQYQGKAFELHIESDFSSQQIFNKLCRALQNLSKERPFKGRYIDLELLLNIGPFINWRRLSDKGWICACKMCRL